MEDEIENRGIRNFDSEHERLESPNGRWKPRWTPTKRLWTLK
jgi:hypothetical protein